MSQATTLGCLGLVALPLALAGCLFEDCPYMLDDLEATATTPARFDGANSTRAGDALEAMGFQTQRERLLVAATKDPLRIIVRDDDLGTRATVDWEAGRREFRSYDAAKAYADAHRAEAAAAINATLADLASRAGWPPFTVGPAEAMVSVC